MLTPDQSSALLAASTSFYRDLGAFAASLGIAIDLYLVDARRADCLRSTPTPANMEKRPIVFNKRASERDTRSSTGTFAVPSGGGDTVDECNPEDRHENKTAHGGNDENEGYENGLPLPGAVSSSAQHTKSSKSSSPHSLPTTPDSSATPLSQPLALQASGFDLVHFDVASLVDLVTPSGGAVHCYGPRHVHNLPQVSPSCVPD